MKTVSEESGGKWCAICIQRFCLTHSIQPNFELRKLENNSPLLRALGEPDDYYYQWNFNLSHNLASELWNPESGLPDISPNRGWSPPEEQQLIEKAPSTAGSC